MSCAQFWQICQILRVHILSDFCARGFGRFVGKVFRAEKFSPRNVGRRIFPSQKYFFCVRGKNSSRNLCRRWFFHRRVINFLANSPKNGKIPKKGHFGGPPPWTPQKPPKTPQNPPRAGRLWASGTRLCIWPLHPIAQGGKSCRNMH